MPKPIEGRRVLSYCQASVVGIVRVRGWKGEGHRGTGGVVVVGWAWGIGRGGGSGVGPNE